MDLSQGQCALLEFVCGCNYRKELIEAGVHFGHRASRWNPKMRPYIHGRKNLDSHYRCQGTLRGLLRAKKYLRQVSANNNSMILFVGTKRQAADTLEREMHSRWNAVR